MIEQDYELLSAYIDGELNTLEREALEARLLTDTALRDELEALRRTVALVRGLPELRAPRNYTLDPALYGRKPAAPTPPNVIAFPRANVRRLLIAAASVTLAFVAVVALLTNTAQSPTFNEAVGQVAAMPTSTLVFETQKAIPFALATQQSPQMQAPSTMMDIAPTSAGVTGGAPSELAMRAMPESTATFAPTMVLETTSSDASNSGGESPTDAMFEAAVAAPTDETLDDMMPEPDMALGTFSTEMEEESVPQAIQPSLSVSPSQLVVWVNVALVVWGVLRVVMR